MVRGEIMGASEILTILDQESLPLSLNEICLRLGDNSNNNKFKVSKAISKMIKHKEIKYIELDKMLAYKFLSCKQTIKLYYV
jgi:hypothetical protein